MRIMKSAVGITAVILAATMYISCSTSTVPGDQTTANVTANEMVYGTENDELTSSTGVMNEAIISPNPITETGTAVFSGLVSGTATVTHNVTWLETDSTGTPYNRTFTFYGTRSVAFSDYSNFAGRTIESGTVTVTIAQSPADTFVSSTNPPGESSPAVGSTITHTVTNVNKTIAGTVTVQRNGNTFTCVLNLTVDVISRVTNWILGTDTLTDPSVQSRDVTIVGTVQVNGTTFNINTTITTVAPQ